MCKEKRDTEATVTTRPRGGDAHRRKSIPSSRTARAKAHGGRDLACKNVKTRPVWLELKEGVQSGDEITEVGRGPGGWGFIWLQKEDPGEFFKLEKC